MDPSCFPGKGVGPGFSFSCSSLPGVYSRASADSFCREFTCFLCFSLWKKHESLAKNGILALWAMSGVANSLCFYVFSVLQALMERRFTRKNTAFLVDFMFN